MKLVKYIIIFILSSFLIDSFLSIFLDKDIYKMINNKIELKEIKKSNKQVDWSNQLEIKKNIPFWTTDYRGPFFNYKVNKKLNCRVVGLGDSILWGSGVGGYETYFNILSDNIKNTEFINLAVPGFDLLQEIEQYNINAKYIRNTDLLIWHIWEDDNHIYNLRSGILYNSNIVVNEITGKPELFSFLGDSINNFLLKKSFLYNELLKVKLNGQIKSKIINNDEYILEKLKETLISYLKSGKNKKVLILLSPSLSNNNFKSKYWKDNGYPKLYKEIEDNFKNIKGINILYLDTFLKGINVEDIRYDNCCHFNSKGHDIIGKKLFNYIKNNKLLNEKCYKKNN